MSISLQWQDWIKGSENPILLTNSATILSLKFGQQTSSLVENCGQTSCSHWPVLWWSPSCCCATWRCAWPWWPWWPWPSLMWWATSTIGTPLLTLCPALLWSSLLASVLTTPYILDTLTLLQKVKYLTKQNSESEVDCLGKRLEKIMNCLQSIGFAVLNGGFTTWLAVALCSVSTGYIFLTFFKVESNNCMYPKPYHLLSGFHPHSGVWSVAWLGLISCYLIFHWSCQDIIGVTSIMKSHFMFSQLWYTSHFDIPKK